jgi:putative transposase
MARPPRVDAPGTYHLVTTVTYGRQPLLSNPILAEAIVRTLHDRRDAGEFDLPGWVLMPDHVHLVLQPERGDLADVMRRFKSLSWRACRSRASLKTRLWQDGFHDRGIRSQRHLEMTLDYVHRNPVRAGLVDEPAHWPWSSFQDYWSRQDGRGQAPAHQLDRGRGQAPAHTRPWPTDAPQTLSR